MTGNLKLAASKTITALLIVLASTTFLYGGTLQEDFDRLCIFTQEAESLSLEKLAQLVAECDQLKKRIEESDYEKKKVLLFRLEKCRNFFAYIIELKQSGNTTNLK